MGLAETVKESPPKPSCRASPQSKILLVDDEQDILDILARALGIAGYNVDAACNGQLALDKVSAQDYDLIVTNIRMPVMGGEAFYRELCSSYPRLAKRVIFCTGDIASLATQRFLNTTGAPVIFKPFQLSTVLDVVSWKLAKDRTPAHVPALPLTRPGAAISTAF